MYHFEEETFQKGDNTKVYFQVIVDYNKDLIKTMIPKTHADKVDEMGPLESKAISSFDEAEKVADDMTDRIHSKFPGSEIKKLEPEDQKDEYNTWIKHPSGEPLAKIGVIATDYSNVTIH